MADNISAQALFEKLMERSRQLNDRLNSSYRMIGEDALQGKSISDFTKSEVTNLKSRIDEIDQTIKTMQALARES